MTHEEKLKYMKIAAGIVGYGFDEKGLDMLISLYDLVTKHEGDTDVKQIVKVQMEVEERDLDKKAKQVNQTNNKTNN